MSVGAADTLSIRPVLLGIVAAFCRRRYLVAQIFVSHSAKDRDLVALLSRAFAATKVKGVFEEF